MLKDYDRTVKDITKYKWLFETLNKLKHPEILLGGGDLGYISDDILDYIFKILKHNVIINTEYKFFETKFKKYYNRISTVQYHFSDLESTGPWIDDKKVLHGIVDYDIDKIIEFCKKYPNLDYVDIETPINKYISVEESVGLLNKLIEGLESINYKSNIIERLKIKNQNIEYLKDERKKCHKNNIVNFDLSNDKIIKCYRDFNDSIDLTPNNIKKIFSSFHYTDICDSCSRLFMNISNSNSYILDKIELLRNV